MLRTTVPGKSGIILLQAILVALTSCGFCQATTDTGASRFASSALAFRSGGISADPVAIGVLRGTPGAGSVDNDAFAVLWTQFFDNTIVRLGRLHSPEPVALYYNPLLDVAVITH